MADQFYTNFECSNAFVIQAYFSGKDASKLFQEIFRQITQIEKRSEEAHTWTLKIDTEAQLITIKPISSKALGFLALESEYLTNLLTVLHSIFTIGYDFVYLVGNQMSYITSGYTAVITIKNNFLVQLVRVYTSGKVVTETLKY